MAAFFRRLTPAVMLAAAAILAGSAIVEPGTANAKPEWDIEYYDDCMDVVRNGYMAGEYTTPEMGELVSRCCVKSGGVESGGNCSAPPAVAAPDAPSATPSENANPDAPAAPPPTKPATKPPTPQTTFTPAPLAPIG
jgi:hypothetical protein